jgi:uncharacterized protein with HEPN domain
MLDATRSLLRFTQGRCRQDLDEEEMLAFAVLRALEIIGEAASQVSPQGREGCPAIPWALIVGMRHRLIHAYFDVNLDRVWDTLVNSIPPLLVALECVLEPETDRPGGSNA